MNWKEFKQKNLVYKTPLDKCKLRNKLRSVTTENNLYFSNKNRKSKPFAGNIGDESFDITIRLGFLIPIRPEIHGVFKELEDGSQINVRLESDTFLTIFAIIWLSIAMLIFIGTIIYISLSGNISMSQFAPIILPVFGFLAIRTAFDYQIEQLSKVFKERFQAEIVSSIGKEKCI